MAGLESMYSIKKAELRLKIQRKLGTNVYLYRICLLNFMADENDKPVAAFVLSLIGGIFVLLGGIVIAALGAALTFFIGGIGGFYGLFGIIFGIIIIVGSAMLYSNPDKHVLWGAIILVFSIVSWFGSYGGFVIGFLLALIGGILAMVWKPQIKTDSGRVCLKCGRMVPENVAYCPSCGNNLNQA